MSYCYSFGSFISNSHDSNFLYRNWLNTHVDKYEWYGMVTQIRNELGEKYQLITLIP